MQALCHTQAPPFTLPALLVVAYFCDRVCLQCASPLFHALPQWPGVELVEPLCCPLAAVPRLSLLVYPAWCLTHTSWMRHAHPSSTVHSTFPWYNPSWYPLLTHCLSHKLIPSLIWSCVTTDCKPSHALISWAAFTVHSHVHHLPFMDSHYATVRAQTVHFHTLCIAMLKVSQCIFWRLRSSMREQKGANEKYAICW